MYRFMTPLALLAMLSLSVATAHAQISDDFDIDSSADYTVVDTDALLGPRDGLTTFAFDYSTLGIASAPNTSGATTLGLYMTVNDQEGDEGESEDDAVTAFHNTAAPAGNYELSVDIYMGVTGTGGTTEFVHVGVAGDGVTPNAIFSPIIGSGHYLASTGEGGSGSDHRHSKPSQFAVPSGDLSYLNDLLTTNAPGDTYQEIFSAANGYQFPGSPGNSWATLTIGVANGNITYSYNGTPIIADTYDDSDGNLVSLGYADVFSSVASPFRSQFIVYDNLTVTAIPEPTSLALVGLAASMLGFRRRNG